MRQLGGLYRACEIGVWPTQESMSMLDASACGLPLIANDTMHAPERLKDSGMPYRLGDVDSLVRTLRALSVPGIRHELGAAGARRMREEFSWAAIAARRIQDYASALTGKRSPVAVAPCELSSRANFGAKRMADADPSRT